MAAIATLTGAPARFPGGLHEVAPRTWAWLQPNGGLGESNAGLIVGDGESLLADTLWDERLTRRMLGAMEPLLADAPLRRAFVTHPDGDHWWGNAVLDEIAAEPASGSRPGPPVEILALPACDRAMRGESPPRVLNGMARTAALLSRAPGLVGAVARRGHAMVAPFHWRGVRLRYADRLLTGAVGVQEAAATPGAGTASLAGAPQATATPGERPAGLAGAPQADATPSAGTASLAGAPQATARLDVGGRTVRILDVGPTHTAADAVVHVPDVGVVFAADVLFIGVTPIMWHGPVETWLAALDTLLSLDAGVYVPGHGPPCGRAEIEELAAYWRWLRDGVREQRAAGRSASEAAKRLVRSDEQRRWAAWEGAERIVVSVATMYRNLDGGPAEVKPPVRAKLLVQTMALGEELARARS